MTALPWLDVNLHAEADLLEAARLVDARLEAEGREHDRLMAAGHITPDDCDRCGGHGCDACRDCPHCQPRTPDYVRDAVARWRP